jgi:hypothetical protein
VYLADDLVLVERNRHWNYINGLLFFGSTTPSLIATPEIAASSAACRPVLAPLPPPLTNLVVPPARVLSRLLHGFIAQLSVVKDWGPQEGWEKGGAR